MLKLISTFRQLIRSFCSFFSLKQHKLINAEAKLKLVTFNAKLTVHRIEMALGS